jgi:glycerophosphoryl diester phosphodiesterase
MPRRRTVATVAATLTLLLSLGLDVGHAVSAPDATSLAPAHRRRHFDLQAHRGGLALRPENTLSSFGNALRLGVTTLELDVQITEDGAAVVTHDRRVDPVKCADTAPVVPADPEFPYVGKYVKNLTLAQVETLDCGTRRPADPATDPFLPTLEMVPGSRMPVLSAVFDLVKRHRADGVKLNVETKVEAGAPDQTAPREQFVQVVAREVREAGFLDRVTIQSFDWGALMRMREVEPRLPIVALTNFDFLQTGQPGRSPWLGGLDIDDFGGDPLRAIESFGADAFSPVHGFPRNGKVTDPDYRPYVTAQMVAEAHRLGIEVVPWTIDDPATMAKLIDDGVDGIITDFPDRLRALMAERGFRLPRAYPSPFDIQGHRGARAVRPENTLAAFSYALANEAVSTLELDTGVSQDGHLVVIHDRAVNGSHCIDTDPAFPGDPEFPYVGRRVHHLTLRQLKTLDCGSRTLPEFPRQQAVYDDPTLKSPWTAPQDWWRTRDLGRLVRQAGASTVSANWQVHDPNLGHVVSDDWYLKQDPAYFHGPGVPVLQRRHRLEVVPYTINDEATMQRVIDLGVDGIISDDPDLLVLVAKRNGLR